MVTFIRNLRKTISNVYGGSKLGEYFGVNKGLCVCERESTVCDENGKLG